MESEQIRKSNKLLANRIMQNLKNFLPREEEDEKCQEGVSNLENLENIPYLSTDSINDENCLLKKLNSSLGVILPVIQDSSLVINNHTSLIAPDLSLIGEQTKSFLQFMDINKNKDENTNEFKSNLDFLTPFPTTKVNKLECDQNNKNITISLNQSDLRKMNERGNYDDGLQHQGNHLNQINQLNNDGLSQYPLDPKNEKLIGKKSYRHPNDEIYEILKKHKIGNFNCEEVILSDEKYDQDIKMIISWAEENHPFKLVIEFCQKFKWAHPETYTLNTKSSDIVEAPLFKTTISVKNNTFKGEALGLTKKISKSK
jgi:hypothetical protein